ncbi:hypothetical protein CEP52_014975 [Fusarium oligoseptatum]|uniref:Uncharacterized protein n=1 Tax=Fusarium oligoseptatum TaxID=2604345 RepID=A0A428SHH8_9HYPO|nr:hypothetical protein CEP52_014975 [Fusarium oligoseptatum]
MLMETLKAAEGRTDVDEELMEELEGQPAPGDVDVDAPGEGKIFGIPDPEDPDPYGVLALEKEGLEIREAATHSRPSSQQFEYNPSPTSPVYNKFYRRSMETAVRSNRDSFTSSPKSRLSTEISYTTSEAGTQTDPVIITSIASTPDSLKYGAQDDERSIYEDVAEMDYADSPYHHTNGNPWSPQETGIIHHEREYNFSAANDEKAQPRSATPTRIPPPLPPRASTTNLEFEDVSLKDTETK